MKRPSTVVTLAFKTIHATPNSGTIPSIKESVNIIVSQVLCSAGILPASLGAGPAGYREGILPRTTTVETAALLKSIYLLLLRLPSRSGAQCGE
jgi:hypothetical protein